MGWPPAADRWPLPPGLSRSRVLSPDPGLGVSFENGATNVICLNSGAEGLAWHRDGRGCIARRMQPDFHHGLLGACFLFSDTRLARRDLSAFVQVQPTAMMSRAASLPPPRAWCELDVQMGSLERCALGALARCAAARARASRRGTFPDSTSRRESAIGRAPGEGRGRRPV